MKREIRIGKTANYIFFLCTQMVKSNFQSSNQPKIYFNDFDN
jgi:hypothetical protein